MRLRHKIFHFLFGWDFVHWKNSCDQGIRRVRVDFEGNPYYVRYSITNVIDKLNDPCILGNVIWLTCKRSKYLKEIDN